MVHDMAVVPSMLLVAMAVGSYSFLSLGDTGIWILLKTQLAW